MLVENINNYDFLLCLRLWNENKPNSMLLKQFSYSWVKKELRTEVLQQVKECLDKPDVWTEQLCFQQFCNF